jgi:hypothetical protein
MTTNTLTCVYKLTAVGAVPVATLAARFAAVPIDLSVPRKCGLLYFSDATATVGQVVTRTIVLRATPTTAATATASRFVGDVSGSPIQLLTLTGDGADYAAPPIVGLFGGTPNNAGKATASMGVGRGLVINPGVGYVAPTIAFVGGQLAPGGTQATGTIAQIGGALQAPVITAAGGPYEVPPVAVVTDTSGTGGLISPSLKVTALTLVNPGFGYETAPPVVFTPFFASCCPDTFADTQKAHVRSWMTSIFRAALTTPVYAEDPVIA